MVDVYHEFVYSCWEQGNSTKTTNNVAQLIFTPTLSKHSALLTCCCSSRISSASLAEVSSLQRAARSSQLCLVEAGSERHSLPTMREISPTQTRYARHVPWS